MAEGAVPARDRMVFDADADRLVTSLVTMLATADSDRFATTLRSVLLAYRRYFDVEGLRLTFGPTVIEVGRLEGVVERVVRVGPRARGPMTLELTGSRGRPVSAAADAIARAVLSSAVVVAERMDTGSRLRHLASHDDLTGLLNRRAFGAEIEARTAAADGDPIALVRCEVDRLTAVNSTFGVEAGDAVLRAVADRLAAVAGPDAVVGRVGGDEFGVLFTDVPDLTRFTDDVRERLEQPVAVVPRAGGGGDRAGVEPAEVARTVTLGVAVTGAGVDTAAELVRCATQATRGGKRRGGAVTMFYDDSMRRADVIRDEVEVRLPRAIANDELVLHYQPEVDLRDTRVLGAEALVRWNHPTLGLLLPDTFIETVELSPYALRFGRWVLESACGRWARWLERYDWDREHPPRLRVNITAVQLMDVDFVDTVARTLARTGLPAAALGLEITERDVVRDRTAGERTLRGLADLGVTVALDDFGTGYSSFEQLRRSTLSTVKIDRSFVAHLATDDGDRSIVTAIVSLARSLGVDVVAEGVQDHAAAGLLVALGCHRGQGFLYSRPLPPEELEPILRAGFTGTR